MQEVVIVLIFEDQFFVRALMDVAFVIDEEHPVHIVQGGKPVGDHDRSDILEMEVDVLPELLFILGVERGGDVVQDKQFRVAHQGAGDGEPLLLPAGNAQPPLSQSGLITLGEGFDLLLQL